MDAVALDRRHVQQVQVASGLDALAGLWLLISVFTFPTNPSLAWSNGIFGVIVLILASTRAMGAYNAAGLSWLNMLIGIWVLISPWVLSQQFAHAEWNTFGTGIAIIVLAAWSAIATSSRLGDAMGSRSYSDRDVMGSDDILPPRTPL